MPRQTRKSRLDDLVAAFTELGPAWGRWLNVNMPQDVSYVRLRLLRALETHVQQAMTMTELANALDVTQRRVTALVDALEAEGQVERRRHPTDGRSTIVAITEKGIAQHRANWERRQADISEVFADLSVTHQLQLLELTPLLTDALRRRASEKAAADGDGCE